MRRSEAREVAFLLMFEKEFSTDDVAAIIELAKEARDVQLSAFARRLFEGAVVQMEAIDAQISACAHNWQMSRLAKVSLAILRVAVYEMCYETETPEAVVINEAVELAKKYGGDEEATFVNGVLGGVSRRERS